MGCTHWLSNWDRQPGVLGLTGDLEWLASGVSTRLKDMGGIGKGWPRPFCRCALAVRPVSGHTRLETYGQGAGLQEAESPWGQLAWPRVPREGGWGTRAWQDAKGAECLCPPRGTVGPGAMEGPRE